MEKILKYLAIIFLVAIIICGLANIFLLATSVMNNDYAQNIYRMILSILNVVIFAELINFIKR